MSTRPNGVYRIIYSDKTESINYWDGSFWLFFGVRAKCKDKEMGFSFIYPITLNEKPEATK